MKAGIAGAGIMGQLIAYSLIQQGWEVTLFDRNPESNCSMAAAGLLSPIAELDKNDLLIHQLGCDALTTHWPAILETLNTPIYFKKNGSLIVSHPRDCAELRKYLNVITQKLRHSEFYKKLSIDELITLEPDMSKFEAYYIADEGQIDNQSIMTALHDYLIRKGITYYSSRDVVDIQPHKIMTREKTHIFDWVFDCRGLGAKKNNLELRGVRGELLWLHAKDVTITRPIRFMHPRYSLYIVPRPNHVYLIGATEIESEDDSPISVRSTLELLTAAYAVNARFAEARIIKTITHCRPTRPNNLPYITMEDGIISINGLYRHGFLIAPTLAVRVMHFLNTGENTYDNRSIQ